MRLANVLDRAAIGAGDSFVDVAAASGGRFGPDPQPVYEQWTDFAQWGTLAVAPV